MGMSKLKQPILPQLGSVGATAVGVKYWCEQINIGVNGTACVSHMYQKPKVLTKQQNITTSIIIIIWELLRGISDVIMPYYYNALDFYLSYMGNMKHKTKAEPTFSEVSLCLLKAF